MAPGGQNIIVNLPNTADPTVVSKVVFMSLANQLELFFIPGGTVPKANATFTINVHDTALIASADYLNNEIISLPSCASLAFYHGRMMLIGQDKTPDNLLASDVGNPESFNAVTGVIHMPVDYGINTSNGSMIIRDTFYVTKPNGTYAIQDNGNTPSTWGVTIIDSGIGAWQDGISTFASTMSGQDVLDSCFVANERGLMLFDGTYGQIPLTYKIETLWRTIDPNYFQLVQVAHDTWKKRIYLAVPLDYTGLITKTWQPQTVNKIILMGDYQEGLDAAHIKWSTWNSTVTTKITKLNMENFFLNYAGAIIYQLAFCGQSTIIYKIVPDPTVPDQQSTIVFKTINQNITTGPITKGQGGIYTYTMLDFSVSGIGKMFTKLFGKSKIVDTNQTKTFDLSQYTGKTNLQLGINLTSEALFINLSNDTLITAPNVQSQITLDQIEVYLRKMWNMRPALTQSN